MIESRQQSQFKLFIATDIGYDSIVRAAMATHDTSLVLYGAGDTFPFRLRPSTILVPHMPAGVIACIPALEEFGVASRLASTAGRPGCYDGSVIELATLWLQSRQPDRLRQIHITVSGPEATVTAAKKLGGAFQLSIADIQP